MNNTTTGLAGKKRKAPPAPANSTKTTTTTTPTTGVDTVLTLRGRPLAVGESLRFVLVKGPSATRVGTGDPVDSTSPLEKFPLIAKFGESVVRPHFTRNPWQSARLYQQEIPKPIDDSDDDNDKEEETADHLSSINRPRKKRWRYGAEGTAPRQWILQENVDFLQTMVDRKEQQQQQSSNSDNLHGDSTNAAASSSSTLSSRYEGIPEHNSSLYALIRVAKSPPQSQLPDNEEEETLQVCLLPQDRNCTIPFSQPAARKTYSLTEAEHVISDQRMGLVQNLHHMGNPGRTTDTMMMSGATTGSTTAKHDSDAAGDTGGSNPPESLPPPPPRPNILALRKKAAHSSKGRLLNRLQAKSKTNEEEEDGDDVMADVTFKHRKGSGGGARKELLQSMQEGVTVSEEGVLGGTNDVMFGGRQRFAQLVVPSGGTDGAGGGNRRDGGEGDGSGGPDGADGGDGRLNTELGGANDEKGERGADGAAMDDDFYQRDVQAEYEELDYDAKEQFDDDDVDLGEGEVMDTGNGMDGADDLDDELDDEDEDNDEDDGNKGAEGLASLAGFQALLAKARGEVPANADGGGEDGTGGDANGTSPDSSNLPSTNAKKQSSYLYQPKKKKTLDHMSKIMLAAEKSRLDAEAAQHHGSNNTQANTESLSESPAVAPAATLPPPPVAPTTATTTTTTTERDANGLRIISKVAVQQEIWLNHGSIPMKRLMKIFDVKKKSPQERQDQFRDIVKELCIMKSDPINGRMLVLKQHYARGS